VTNDPSADPATTSAGFEPPLIPSEPIPATRLPVQKTDVPPRKRFLAPLGLFAGFIDATGGGGWGPVATPTLISSGKMTPRKVIGTVDTSEFAVSAAASVGFFIGLGAAGINWGVVLALLIGGLIAAPLAAVLVRYAPAHLLGVAVGGVILLTNSRTLLKAADVETPARFAVYGAILLITIVGLSIASQRVRRRKADQPAEVEASAEV